MEWLCIVVFVFVSGYLAGQHDERAFWRRPLRRP